MDIAVIGSNMVDLVTYVSEMPKLGETLEARSFEIGCGGKGANQAIASAKLGSKVMMITRVGDDLFADNTIKNFQDFNVDTQFVRKVANRSSGVAPIFVDPEAHNRILIIKGANQFLLPSCIDEAAEQLKQCKLIILQLEIPLETVYAAIDFANQHNIPVILNPAPATKDLDMDYACKCDFFMPNETELEILTGMPVDTEDSIYKAGQSLLQKGLRNLIITVGHRGSIWMSQAGSMRWIAPYHVQAVDSSGAGDAFIGCFAHYYVQTGEVIESMQKASAYAAYSVTGKGTQRSYPNTEQFADFLSKHNLEK